jgi:uncharacterized protein
MRTLIKGAIVALALLATSPVMAQDWYKQDKEWEAWFKGWEAYRNSDYAAAVRQWKPLAEQGDAQSQFELGSMYRDGQGVPQDYREAAKWFQLAAEQGHMGAQNNLGLMYSLGRGVLQDSVIAHMWSNLAAAQGYIPSSRYAIAKRMTPAANEEAQRLARECLAQSYRNCGR